MSPNPPRPSVVRTTWVPTLVSLALVVTPSIGHGQAVESEVERSIRGRVEALRSGLTARAGGDRLLATQALPLFYERRGFAPAWLGPRFRSRTIGALLEAIDRSAEHGLDPGDYHRDDIVALHARVSAGERDPIVLTDVDMLASDAFMVLGSHLLHGRVDPETIDPEWLANRRSGALHEVLAEALRSGRVEAALYRLAPQQPRYEAMVEAARRLRRVTAGGGWPLVPTGPKLEVGMDDERVALLRARLSLGGDLPAGDAEGTLFDEGLAEGVRSFQSRHGLEVDGVAGSATFAALNVPVEARVRQLEVNLERWRWLPADLGERHVEVNIAGFDVKVVESGRVVRKHRAIVGRQYRQTPAFTGSMTYLVLAPYWHVPPTIAAVDKFPVIREDPAAIAAQRMTLLDQRTNEPVDPTAVDWASLTGPEFNRRYRLRQDPGPLNALGDVKFMFPNRHNVSLHDTPSRELFGRASRGFSSGCIRVENPMELAEYLLADQPGWDRARLDQTVAGGVERTVRLTSAVPVHLLYWTAWAAEDGVIQMRDDIYGRDGTVRRALDAPPPGA